ncbi:MAG: hypothetical protein JXM70_11200 [Pirellulales bacterium]|nr:hypothetical protein [Pirellulales bacterium]
MILSQNTICTVLLSTIVMATGATLSSPARADDSNSQDYLNTVQAFADAMLEHGRDRYGREHTPLFAAALDRKTMSVPRGDLRRHLLELSRDEWGIRTHDRMLSGANPMHDQNLYQVLYALTAATGDRRYAQEADKTLKWFFEHCQSPATGLLTWGEHMGWDFFTEKPISDAHEFPDGPLRRMLAYARDNHEYTRPWLLSDRCFQLAPQPSARFARGVWEHQIGDHKTGNFSRHAGYRRHSPDRNAQFPRHGGFYINTWAHAYKQTYDPVFLEAIEILLAHFETRRNPKSHAIPSNDIPVKGTKKFAPANKVWLESNLSLAIDLWTGAALVPKPLAEKMKACARKTDEIYLQIPHDLGSADGGFVSTAVADTLEPSARTRTWEAGYGHYTDAQVAMICLARWRQVKLDGYRKLFIQAADRYMQADPDYKSVVWPGAMGDAIMLLVETYRETGEKRYLDRANQLARKSLTIFFPKDSPLPKASSKHDHYESITRADTLVMALLNLWACGNNKQLNLVYVDR